MGHVITAVDGVGEGTAVRVGAVELGGWLHRFAVATVEHKQVLTDLDSAIGDADHGINMDRGMRAVSAALGDPPQGTLGDMFRSVGMTLVSTVGGASGPLYGTFFLRFATAVGDAADLDPAGLGAALRAGLGGVQSRGKAEPGDKTMVDALLPALDAWDAAVTAGEGSAGAARAAAAAAARGRDATVPLVARKGRASYLGERSAGHTDPGAASTVLLFEALADALAGAPDPGRRK